MYFFTPGNPSLTHKYVLSDVVSEPLTNKTSSIAVVIINATDSANLAEK